MTANATSSAHEAVAVRCMVADASFAVRLMLSIRSLEGMTPLAMAATPLLALSLHETHQWFGRRHPEIELPAMDASQVSWMRNSGKWFADKSLDVAGSLSAFEQLVDAHRAEFIDGIRLPFLRSRGRDLGVYNYDGMPFLTTHGFGFALDRDPNAPRERLAEISFEVGKAIGATARSLIDVESITDLSSLANVLQATKLTDDDVRSSEYYLRGGSGDPALRGYLHSIWAQLGLATLLPLTPLPADQATALKYQIVILSHAVSAIDLIARTGNALGSRVAEARPQLTVGTGFRQLRNVLVHYTPRSEMPDSDVDFALPLFGLIEHHLEVDFATAAAQVGVAVAELRSALSDELESASVE